MHLLLAYLGISPRAALGGVLSKGGALEEAGRGADSTDGVEAAPFQDKESKREDHFHKHLKNIL